MGFNKVVCIKCLAHVPTNVRYDSGNDFMIRVSREFCGGMFIY